MSDPDYGREAVRHVTKADLVSYPDLREVSTEEEGLVGCVCPDAGAQAMHRQLARMGGTEPHVRNCYRPEPDPCDRALELAEKALENDFEPAPRYHSDQASIAALHSALALAEEALAGLLGYVEDNRKYIRLSMGSKNTGAPAAALEALAAIRKVKP